MWWKRPKMNGFRLKRIQMQLWCPCHLRLRQSYRWAIRSRARWCTRKHGARRIWLSCSLSKVRRQNSQDTRSCNMTSQNSIRKAKTDLLHNSEYRLWIPNQIVSLVWRTILCSTSRAIINMSLKPIDSLKNILDNLSSSFDFKVQTWWCSLIHIDLRFRWIRDDSHPIEAL